MLQAAAPYRFPGVNGLAVSVGLIDSTDARQIMQQIADDLTAVGFRRYDLGVPVTLDPIEPFDYLAPAGLGYPDPSLPNRNWRNYENGGITPTQTAYYLNFNGLIRANLSGEAKRILQAMLRTQAAEGFQNGIVNEYPKGVDWRTWEGAPCGYEGYLNDSGGPSCPSNSRPAKTATNASLRTMRHRSGSSNGAGRFRCSTGSWRDCANEFVQHGRPEHFERLKVFLLGQSDAPYAALAREMNTSEGALEVAIHRLRKRYRELFRQEIADTVADPAEVESEFRYLSAVPTRK
jgi:hypothetical protein